MEAPVLSSAERKRLRGQAMSLKPAVLVGKAGLTPSCLAAIDAALARLGLVKLRVEAADRDARRELVARIGAATGAALCGETGHTAVFWRPIPPAPAAAPRPASRG